MYKQQQQQKRKAKTMSSSSNNSSSSVQMSSNHNINEAEVSSMEWELIKMSQQEEDLIHRMHNIVGDRWGLIAGRIPGRTAEEIERFWIMKHSHAFSHYTTPPTTTTTTTTSIIHNNN